MRGRPYGYKNLCMIGGELFKVDLEKDKEARNKMIVQNRGLVFYIANQYGYSADESDELVSVGMIGLIKAADTFRPEKKMKFTTYAVPCIRNEIRMYIRRNQKYKREISLNTVLKIDEDGNSLCLSDILGTEPDVVSRRSEEEADREMLRSAMNALSMQERDVISLFFGMDRKDGKGRTQREVGKQLGISNAYASRLKHRALRHLRRELVRMAGESNFSF